jgi:outer membrane protein
LVAAAVACVVLAGFDANAQDASSKWRFTVGGGVAFVPDYEGSDDYRATPFPMLRAQKGAIFAQVVPGRFGLNIESNLLPSENWRLGPFAALRPGQRDVQDKRVDNVRSGGTTAFDMGLMGGYDFKFSGNQVLGLTLFAAHDVSGVYDGYQIVPEIEYRRPLGESWSMRLDASGAFASGGYMSEYYGIDSKDAQRSGLDRHSADAAFKDFGVGANFGYAITQRWGLNLGMGYKRLFGDAEDSPVVDDQGSENQFVGSLGISYTW